MSKWNLIIDVAKCHDCNNCFLACKDEFVENDWSPYSVPQPAQGHKWMNIMRRERGQYPLVDVSYLPTPCMHCDDADCVKAAEKGAVYQREDGIVIIDPVKAKGQKAIVDSCPYGVIFWNEELDVPQKCTFCAHLLDDRWTAPRCVQACPTGALMFLRAEESEMQREVESEGLETLHPEYGLEPRVYYKNLFRYTRCFVAGSVALKEEDECAEGATVTLTNDSKTVSATTVTNNYGDFVIDGLVENSGPYGLEIQFPGYQTQNIRVELKGSLNVGTIFL